MRTKHLRHRIRRVRKAHGISRWPRRRKIAVGAWIPVLVAAVALYTGPNRTASAHPRKAATAVNTPLALGASTSTTVRTGPPVPRAKLGMWIRRGRKLRKHTSPPSVSIIESQIALKVHMGEVRLRLMREARALRVNRKVAPSGPAKH